MSSLDFLLWLQDLRNPLFNALFALITFLGSPDFALILAPLIYWCVNRTLGLRLGLVLLGSAYANEAMKNIVLEPRPGPPVVPLDADTAPGSSWPSGHAMNAAALWGALAGIVRGRRYALAAGILIFLIGFSRLYLGLHWPVDVISGWIIGGALAALALWLIRTFPRLMAQDIPAYWLAGVVIALALLLVLTPTSNAATPLGTAAGIIIGWRLERQYVGFEAAGAIVQQIIKLAIGLIGAFALRFALKPLFEPLLGDVAGDFIRYAIIGLWVAWAAPAIFVRLFSRQPTTTNAQV